MSRDLLVGRSVRPTPVQEALVQICAHGAQRPSSLGRDLACEGDSLSEGACHDRGIVLVHFLIDGGFAAREGRGRYGLTEKGRIAAALVMFFNPGMVEAYFDWTSV